METVFKESVSQLNQKKMTENINYLEKENEDLRERIYDLENSLHIHKNLVTALSDDKNFDPQARYYTEQLNQESELLHAKIEKLTTEKSQLRSQLVIKAQMELQEKDYENEEIKALKEEIEEMKANLDRKEYLLQYCEQRNTEMEKLLKKRAMHDDYIKKRLEGLSIEPDKERTIRNVVEDCTMLREENENLRRENKSLREQLDYAMSNNIGNQNEMTIFANNIKPTPQVEDLDKLKNQTKSKDLYLRKLEEMVRSYIVKLEKFKEDLKNSKSEVNILKDRVQYFDGLNEKLKKAVVKYKSKCEELEEKINDQGVKVWVKENSGAMRVKPATMVIPKSDDENDTGDKDIDDDDINVDINPDNEDQQHSDRDKPVVKNHERAVDEFEAKDDDSLDLENDKGGEIMLDRHFPDESTIVINVDHDEHEEQDSVIENS
jgi:chromosome segregation ATPase